MRVLARRGLVAVLWLACACTSDLDRFHIGGGGTGGSDLRSTTDAGADGGAGSDAAPHTSDGAAADEAGATADDAATDGMIGTADGGCDAQTVYADDDADSYGDPTTAATGCERDGWVSLGGDCADDDKARHPGVAEACNDVDDNCDNATDEGCECATGMSKDCGAPDGNGGLLASGECRVGTQMCVDDSWQPCMGDVGPAAETCNLLNDDCDGASDEGLLVPLYTDGDGDGFGEARLADGCPAAGSGIADKGGDCQDGNDKAYPGAPELCNVPGSSDCDAGTDPHCPTMPPSTPASCPALATGSGSLFGVSVRLWVGARSDVQPAPIVIYFHGTGATGAQATLTFAWLSQVTDQGGIVIAPNDSTGVGDDTFNGTWYTGDFALVDQIVACAIAQLNIDRRRIYAIGTSGGAIQAAMMGYQRSGYIAGVLTDSGGLVMPNQAVLQDSGQAPAVMTMHGKMGSDVVIVDFATISRALDDDIVAKGGFAIDCDHMGGHAAAPVALKNAGWQFLQDHPFGVTPEPYTGPTLPAVFPGYCSIID